LPVRDPGRFIGTSITPEAAAVIDARAAVSEAIRQVNRGREIQTRLASSGSGASAAGVGVGLGASLGTDLGTGLELMELPDLSVYADQLRDWLDQLLPEEAIGLEFGGSTATGQRIYNGVYIEDGKVKYKYPNGTIRTLGYTPEGAKKKYKTKRRAKRWTQRDQKEMEWKAYIASIAAGRGTAVPPI